MLARITGVVLGTTNRAGVSKTSGNAYDVSTVRVLVADSDVTSVTYQTVNDMGARFAKGDVVDLLAEIDVYRGEANLRLVAVDYEEHANAA